MYITYKYLKIVEIWKRKIISIILKRLYSEKVSNFYKKKDKRQLNYLPDLILFLTKIIRLNLMLKNNGCKFFN